MKIKDIEIRWLGHSSFLIKNSSRKVIYIDPYNLLSSEPADVILITHPHYDHCSIQDILKIARAGTTILCPADCQSKISRIENKINLKVIDVGQTIEINGLAVGGVPAYNIIKQFHPKEERWPGYLLKFEDSEITIYHAGDTDLIPEMKKLQGKVKIALLPVSGIYTMNAQEASEAAFIIKPDLAIPMHYGSIAGTSTDAEVFAKLCEGKGVKAEILRKE